MNHQYVDVFVVWGREVGDPPVFVEQMDPESHAIAQYYRISNGMNPHARPALPGGDPRSDGPPLGRCDDAACLAWQDRGLGETCPDCSTGTVQPYDGFTRSGSMWAPGLTQLMKAAMVAFAGQPGAQDAFVAGGATLEQALDDFMATPAFYGLVMQNGLYQYKVLSQGIYDFLCTEEVPDPIDGTLRVLLETA